MGSPVLRDEDTNICSKGENGGQNPNSGPKSLVSDFSLLSPSLRTTFEINTELLTEKVPKNKISESYEADPFPERNI